MPAVKELTIDENTETEWLDNNGYFRFGKYGPDKGQHSTYQWVGDNDPGYLRWVLDQNVCNEDYELIHSYLARIGELND